jgi:hypothetical protein
MGRETKFFPGGDRIGSIPGVIGHLIGADSWSSEPGPYRQNERRRDYPQLMLTPHRPTQRTTARHFIAQVRIGYSAS